MPEPDSKAAPGKNSVWSNGWLRFAAALIALGVAAALGGLVILLTEDDDDASGTVFTGDVRILAPEDEAVLTGPFTLRVESPTYTIADPAQGIAGAAHFHAFVDIRPFTEAGQVIPQQAGIYHFFADSIELDLPPGAHRIVLALGDNDDVRIPGATVTGIDVVVE